VTKLVQCISIEVVYMLSVYYITIYVLNI
jgi:hypothetical protein